MTEYRIKVVPDEFNFGECPLGWSGDDYAGVSLDYWGRLEIEGDLADTVTRTALENSLVYADSNDDFYSAAVRHFQRRGYLVADRTYHDMHDGHLKRYILAIDVKDETGPWYIDRQAEIYERWLAGDVYGVILEQKVRYVCALEDNTILWEDEIESWDTVPDCAIWGCYLDSDYTALDVARDYFDVELPDDVEVIYTRPKSQFLG